MEARYLRVKNWAELQPSPRRPWLNLAHDDLFFDEQFSSLNEREQWQLVRIWMLAAEYRIGVLCDGEAVPVVPASASVLQRAIQSIHRVPVARFVALGLLMPVDESDVCPIDPPRDPGQFRSYPPGWQLTRRRVLERDGNLCRYCGCRSDRPHIDHVIPRSRGGSDSMENLVTACAACNLRKRTAIWEPLPLGSIR